MRPRAPGQWWPDFLDCSRDPWDGCFESWSVVAGRVRTADSLPGGVMEGVDGPSQAERSSCGLCLPAERTHWAPVSLVLLCKMGVPPGSCPVDAQKDDFLPLPVPWSELSALQPWLWSPW